MADEWRWKVGEFIQRDGSNVLVQITDVVVYTHPGGGRALRIVAGGVNGYEGPQREFESTGWQRVEPPLTENAT